MTATGPCTRARRILTASIAMLLLVLGAATASADPQPGPTTITVKTQLGDDAQVVAAGTLTDSDGTPVPGAEVEAHLDETTLTQGTTDDDGAYRMVFALPDTTENDEQQLVVLFGGRDQLEASQAATNLPAAEPSSPPPDASPTPEDTRLHVFLNVSIAPATVTAGGLVTIEGTLTDENEAPINGARISTLLDDEESQDSRVQTNDEGSFKTFAEVPSDREAGGSSLVVSFAGNNSFTPGLKKFDVTVEVLPMDDGTTPSAAPVEDAAPETAPADATAPATAEATDSTTEAKGDRSPLSWFYVTLIIVGGVALLTAAALAFRGLYGRRDDKPADGGSDVDRLLAPDPEADDEEGAFLSETFSEVDEDQPGEPEETQQIPPARRSLD